MEPKEGRLRSAVLATIVVISILGFLEIGIRTVMFVANGFSPYYLLYGSKSWGADRRFAVFDGYFKFLPSRVLHQYGMFTVPTPIQINSLGFRGGDFRPEKVPGRYRVICLGESSTFGFYSRDGHTYPAVLQRLFDERPGTGKVEVLNAGLPQANSDNMVAMLKGELLAYRPDLITLYAGYNDAAYMADETHLQSVARWIHGHYATYVALKRFIAAAGGPVLHSRWASYLPRADHAHVTRQAALHVARYQANLEETVRLARGAGAEVMFIMQPVTTSWGPQSRVPRMPYREELAWIRQHLEREGWVTANEAALLVHRALMDAVQNVAARHSVPVVDNIAIINERPEYLASYVHLTEEGNSALAQALREHIEKLRSKRG